jgi:hypothetical protein
MTTKDLIPLMISNVLLVIHTEYKSEKMLQSKKMIFRVPTHCKN